MGTVGNKIDYLNETKGLMKQSIRNQGITVEDTDTFRSYAEKIDNIQSVNVKLFNNKEELEADTTSVDGDLAMVYNKETKEFKGMYEYVTEIEDPNYISPIDDENIKIEITETEEGTKKYTTTYTRTVKNIKFDKRAIMSIVSKFYNNIAIEENLTERDRININNDKLALIIIGKKIYLSYTYAKITDIEYDDEGNEYEYTILDIATPKSTNKLLFSGLENKIYSDSYNVVMYELDLNNLTYNNRQEFVPEDNIVTLEGLTSYVLSISTKNMGVIAVNTPIITKTTEDGAYSFRNNSVDTAIVVYTHESNSLITGYKELYIDSNSYAKYSTLVGTAIKTGYLASNTNGNYISGTLEYIEDYETVNGAGIHCYVTRSKLFTGCTIEEEKILKAGYRFIIGTSCSDVANSIELTADKIMAGNTILKVAGTGTSDADATAEDIAEGKTAYVNGKKVTGTATPVGETGEFNAKLTREGNTVPFKVMQIDLIDTSEMNSMNEAFKEFDALITIPLIDTSNAVGMYEMFRDCASLTTIPLLNTSNVKDMRNMFNGCSALTTIPLLDTSNVTQMTYMFYNCKALTEIPTFNTSKVFDMSQMFYYCTALTTIPLLDTSNVTQMKSMFAYCSNLITIPAIDTSKVTTMYFMFNNCKNLTTVPLLDASKVVDVSSMFQYCSALETIEGLKNLGQAYTRKTANYSTYKLDLSVATNLTYESLMNVINNLYDLNQNTNLSVDGVCQYTQSLVLGETNIAKLTEEEIAIATSKGWSVS